MVFSAIVPVNVFCDCFKNLILGKGPLGFTRMSRRLMVQKEVTPLLLESYKTKTVFLLGLQRLCVHGLRADVVS